ISRREASCKARGECHKYLICRSLRHTCHSHEQTYKMTRMDQYQPSLFAETLPAPRPELVELARRLPPSVRFGTSTWTYDGWAGDVFKDAVLGPYERTFGDHAGAFVFEFQAMRGRDLPDPLEWADQLDRFFEQLPAGPRYAVELRNPELFTDIHGEVLKRHAVAHVFNSWTDVPTIGAQLALGWTFTAPFTVARALLKPGRAYGDAVKLFEPYDRLQEPLPELRRDLVRLIDETVRRRTEALILVNNRAEGYAPGTIRAL